MKKGLLLLTILSISICFGNAQIIADFENTTAGSTSFMAGGETFSLTGDLMTNEFDNFSCDDFTGKNKYIDSGYKNGGTSGVLGTITPMGAGVIFRLSTSASQCGWPGQEDGEQLSTGTIRFKGTKTDGSTIQEDFEITAPDFHNLVSFTFSQSIWGEVDLVSLQLEIVGTQDATDYFALDNLAFEKIGEATIFWSEDFETDGHGARYVLDNVFIDQPNDPEGSEDYFGRIQNTGSVLQYVGCTTAPIDVSNPYSGQSGQFFIAGEDVNDANNAGGCGNPNTDSAERNLSFLTTNGHAININGASEMIFRILVANGANDLCGEATSRWDEGDGLKVFYKKDGGAEVEALCFAPNLECSIPMDVSNEPLHLDLDCDGDGEDGFVDNVFSEYSFSIPAGGNSLDIRVWIHADLSDEEIAFDNLRLEAENHPLTFAALPSICEGGSLSGLGGATPAGGTYSGPGVTDNGNGTFDFNAAAAGVGTHTITYSIGASMVTTTIQVLPADDASFSYSATSYCMDGADPTPTITDMGGGSFSSMPAGLAINGTTGLIDVSASSANSYTITYTTASACPNSSSMDVTINGLDDASFSYSAISYCEDSADPTPTVSGVPGGSFISMPVGLSIDGITGTIDVSASTPNTYTITYVTTGTCPNSSNVNVTIKIPDDIAISYSADSYCMNDADPTPTIMGLGGGFFESSPNGLSINSSTGEIDLSGSAPGSYEVTYINVGACPNTVSQTVTLIGLDDASFSYGAASYEVDGTDPTPTISGLLGGSFTSTPVGLGIDAVTGTIDLSASTPNTYSVTYTTNGVCPNSSDFNLSINDIVPPPDGDDCPDAQDINDLFDGPLNEPQVSGIWDNTNATSMNDPTTGIDCFFETGLTHTIWYSFTGDGSTYRIRSINCNVMNYNSDPQVAIYSGGCSNLTPVACNEDEDSANPTTFNIQVDIVTESGVEYLMMIDGHDGAVGEFCLEVTKLAPNALTDISEVNVEVFPNPTNGFLEIKGIIADQIEVVNTNGKTLMRKEIETNKLDVSHLPTGVYLLKMKVEEQVLMVRVVKE